MKSISGQLSEQIKKEAIRTGFDFCGIAPAMALSEEEEKNYREWIRMGNYGNMAYLEKNLEKRLDPRNVMPGTKSVIALLLNYYPQVQIPAENNYIISKYAYGKDYHTTAKNMLAKRLNLFSASEPAANAEAFIDSGVLMEKYWAEKCGLGWRGKNTLLINKDRGSFHFIAIILSSLELEYDLPATDHCEACDRCVRACPTGALEQPHVLNPLKCISYQTIENPEPVPEFVAGRMHDRIFGCDICQDACPFNQLVRPHND